MQINMAPCIFLLVKFRCTNCMAFSNSKYMFFHSYVHEGSCGLSHDNYRQTETDNMQVTGLKMSPINSLSQDLRTRTIAQVVRNILAFQENICPPSCIVMLFSHLGPGTTYGRVPEIYRIAIYSLFSPFIVPTAYNNC